MYIRWKLHSVQNPKSRRFKYEENAKEISKILKFIEEKVDHLMVHENFTIKNVHEGKCSDSLFKISKSEFLSRK